MSTVTSTKPVVARRRPYHTPSILTVAGVALAFLLFVVFAISGNPFGRKPQSISAMFDDVTGVKEGSQVLFLGMPVGKVKSMRYEPPRGLVRVTMLLTEADEIPADVIPYIGGTVLGEAFISLRLPTNQEGAPQVSTSTPTLAQQVKDQQEVILEGRKLSRLESLFPGFDESLKGMLGGASADYRGVSDWLKQQAEVMAQNLADLRTFSADVRKTFSSEGAAGARLTQLADQIQGLVSGQEGNPGLVGVAAAVVTDLRKASGALVEFLTNTESGQPGLVKRLDSILANSAGTISSMEKTLSKAQATLARFDQSSDSVKKASAEVGVLSAEMRDLMHRAEANNKFLYRSLVGKQLAEEDEPTTRTKHGR